MARKAAATALVNFSEAEAYLYSLGNEVETMKLGLGNIKTLLDALGNPQTNYKKVQVAGTNGKGSVCAFLDSIYGEAGIRRGLYTSPHLVSITERIRIEGVDISEDEFAGLATRVRSISEGLVAEGKLERVPTYFEQVTAIALLAFAEAGVELAILETGLGGRYDAVTAAKAEIAAITRIDLDHQEYLGDTIKEIAAEKAAIVTSGTKAIVIGEQSSNGVYEVIRNRCLKFGFGQPEGAIDVDSLDWLDRLPRYANKVKAKIQENVVDLDPFGPVHLGLVGTHQIENAKVAICVIEALREIGVELFGHDRLVTIADVVSGLEKARHAGRLEYIDNFLLDGAHNPGGARALRKYLDESEHRSITLIFSAMRDKNVREIAEILWTRAKTIILTQPLNSRAMTADELAEFAPESVGLGRIVKAHDIEEAMAKAREITAPDGLILVTGSLYLVGEVRKILNN